MMQWPEGRNISKFSQRLNLSVSYVLLYDRIYIEYNKNMPMLLALAIKCYMGTHLNYRSSALLYSVQSK
uniref:Uncharacterized protein n=1 Tax=Arundo donax TaxID=35708 RepID=A0A0A8YY31_ARUDO